MDTEVAALAPVQEDQEQGEEQEQVAELKRPAAPVRQERSAALNTRAVCTTALESAAHCCCGRSGRQWCVLVA